MSKALPMRGRRRALPCPPHKGLAPSNPLLRRAPLPPKRDVRHGDCRRRRPHGFWLPTGDRRGRTDNCSPAPVDSKQGLLFPDKGRFHVYKAGDVREKLQGGNPCADEKTIEKNAPSLGKGSAFFGCDQICKPGSVFDNHLSVAACCHAAHATYLNLRRATLRTGRYRSCAVLLRIGFTWPSSHLDAGELLPRLSTLTRQRRAVSLCCTVPKVAFGWALPSNPALWSPDFPHVRPFGICTTRLSDFLASVL